MTDLPLGVEAYKPAPDGKTLVVAMAVFPDCSSVACTKERLDETAKSKASGKVYDRLFVRHWDTWSDGRQNHLFAVRIGSTAAPVPLMTGFDGDCPTKPFGGTDDFAISPDGKTVLFSAKWMGNDAPWKTDFDLWQTPIDGSAKPKNLTEANKAWDAAAVFSPDGRTVAYRAMRRPGFEADRFAIMLRDMKTGATRPLAADWGRPTTI